MNARQKQLQGKSRTRYHSTPADLEILSSSWSPERPRTHVLPSHNSIDINVDFDEDSDDFSDLGMETNLSSTTSKKSSSVWFRPFMVNNIFM